MNEISVENRADEDADNHEGRHDPGHITTGRVIKPCDFSQHFPEIAHLQFCATEGRWLNPRCFDAIYMVAKLSDGIFYSKFFFSEDVVVKK